MDGDQTGVNELLNVDPQLLNARTPSGVPAVLFSMYYNQPAIVRIFLERGAEVDIFTASAVGMTHRMKTILAQQPGSVNAIAPDGFFPLGLASFFGKADAAQILVEQGAEINAPSQNPQRVMPLHSAVAGQNIEIATLLLDHGAEVNARQSGDFTPLQGAAQNGQVEMVQLLLDHGAELNLRSSEGHTALHFAREGNFSAVITLLESKGAEE